MGNIQILTLLGEKNKNIDKWYSLGGLEVEQCSDNRTPYILGDVGSSAQGTVIKRPALPTYFTKIESEKCIWMISYAN